MRQPVSYFQPMITFTSSMDPSAMSLDLEVVCAQGMDSWMERGQQKVWIARGVTMGMREALPGKPGVMVIVSSMYISYLPLTYVGMEIMVDLVWVRRMVDGSSDGDGKEYWMGEWRVAGSHSL